APAQLSQDLVFADRRVPDDIVQGGLAHGGADHVLLRNECRGDVPLLPGHVGAAARAEALPGRDRRSAFAAVRGRVHRLIRVAGGWGIRGDNIPPHNDLGSVRGGNVAVTKRTGPEWPFPL